MAAPQRITDLAQYWTDRAGQPIVAIVCHATGGGLQSSLSTLRTGDGRGVSIHVLIAQDGTQYVMVPDERAANHAGAPTSSFALNGHTYTGGAVNRATLGVELVNLQDGRDAYPAIQLQSLGWLIAHWRSLHGPLPVLRHADLDPTRRRDPYQLSTQQIEASVVNLSPPPPALHTVITGAFGAIARTDYRAPAPSVAYFQPGTAIEIDGFFQNGYRHVANGIGFIADGDLVVQA